ncbi:MAG: cardiolipin synthase [Muribaculaceae bacterium]
MFEAVQGIDWSWAREIIFIAYALTIVSIIGIVISENRNPVKSLAWVTVLLLLPMLGIVLYLFFGRNIRNQRKLSRRYRRRLKKRAPRSSINFRELNLPPETLQLIRLAHSVGSAPIYNASKVDVFVSGKEKFDSLKKDLLSAKKFINLEYYIFENDKIGTEISEILMKKARSGVTVRVIYDHVGSFTVKSRFFKKMREAGILIFPFFKVSFPQLGTRLNWRNHRKLCVIDGTIGYLGGMNIADRYIDGGKKFASWRDTHVRVEGTVVSALQYAFAVDWHFMGQPLIEEEFNADNNTDSNISVQMLTSGPTSQWSNISYMFHKAICSARRRIYIQTPYFLPTDSLLKGLITAALSGVDVRVLIPRKSDSHLLDNASASYISECLRSGIKIYFYEAGMLHSKLIIVDDDFVTIGSTNFDFRSFEHNFEGNLFFYSQEFTNKMLEIFREDLKQSTRVLPDAWSKRPLVRRAIESVERLLSPIL